MMNKSLIALFCWMCMSVFIYGPTSALSKTKFDDFSGDMTVYDARAFYRFINPIATYNDQATCYGQGIPYRPGKQAEITDYAVFPNPATNAVTVQLPTATEGEVSIYLYTLPGQQVLQHQNQANGQPVSIGTANLPAGLYLLRVQVNGSTVFSTKLEISH